MNIISVSNDRIIIDGIVPIDKEPPIVNGKTLSADPLIRICHAEKKRIIKEYGACVVYNVIRPLSNGGDNKTIISFYYSNTGTQEVDSKHGDEISRRANHWLGEMSQTCAEQIEAYLLDLYDQH